MFSLLKKVVPGLKVFSALVGLAAFALLAAFVYDRFIASPQDLADLEAEALDAAVEEATATLEAFARAHQYHGVAVAPFEGDTLNTQAAGALRSALNAVDGLSVHEESLTDELKQLLPGSADSTDDPVKSQAHAQQLVADTQGVDFVVFGEFTSWRAPDGEQAKVTLALTAQGDTAERLVSKQFTHTAPEAGAASDVTVGGVFGSVWGVLWRSAAFLVFAFLVPIVLGWFAGPAFDADSNAANAAVLVGFAVVDAGAVWALLGFGGMAIGGIVALVLAVLVSAPWNYHVLSVIEERR